MLAWAETFNLVVLQGIFIFVFLTGGELANLKKQLLRSLRKKNLASNLTLKALLNKENGKEGPTHYLARRKKRKWTTLNQLMKLNRSHRKRRLGGGRKSPNMWRRSYWNWNLMREILYLKKNGLFRSKIKQYKVSILLTLTTYVQIESTYVLFNLQREAYFSSNIDFGIQTLLTLTLKYDFQS